MVVEQSVSTCTGPYHLETFLSSITGLLQAQRTMAMRACKRRTKADRP
jgi:hypothetical protein